ncbi:hypothetical protein KEJ32_05485 [Candidatus Bathyarchaeota archaeon]|nr:hypothetical protein [Candidatus Bathyarchaeota archaeon]
MTKNIERQGDALTTFLNLFPYMENYKTDPEIRGLLLAFPHARLDKEGYELPPGYYYVVPYFKKLGGWQKRVIDAIKEVKGERVFYACVLKSKLLIFEL